MHNEFERKDWATLKSKGLCMLTILAEIESLTLFIYCGIFWWHPFLLHHRQTKRSQHHECQLSMNINFFGFAMLRDHSMLGKLNGHVSAILFGVLWNTLKHVSWLLKWWGIWHRGLILLLYCLLTKPCHHILNINSVFLLSFLHIARIAYFNDVCVFIFITHWYAPVSFKGMHAGLPSYVPVNLKDIASAGFQEGEEVSLETLKEKGLINPSGRERRLPLKVYDSSICDW